MKIKKINNNNFLNLFHVILLRLHSFDENLNVIGANLKRVLKILFNFHRSKKQICFIGPAVIIKPLSSIDKKNQHMYLPEESIKQGFLSNIRVKSKKYFSIVKMPDLFVVLNTVIDSKIENEILLSKTIYLPLGRYLSNDNLKRSNFTFKKILKILFYINFSYIKKNH